MIWKEPKWEELDEVMLDATDNPYPEGREHPTNYEIDLDMIPEDYDEAERHD